MTDSTYNAVVAEISNAVRNDITVDGAARSILALVQPAQKQEDHTCSLCDTAGRCTFACETAESVSAPFAPNTPFLTSALSHAADLRRTQGNPAAAEYIERLVGMVGGVSVAAQPFHHHDRHPWAAPGDRPERFWLLRFDDTDRRDMQWFGDRAEAEARAAYSLYSPTYNVTLLATVEARQPEASVAGDRALIEEARQKADYLLNHCYTKGAHEEGNRYRRLADRLSALTQPREAK